MSNIEMSKTLSQTARTIEPVKEKRLELGKKVFKVPTQTKRRSSRIQRPEAKFFQNEKTSTAIVHHLLLAPTLKRQRKKKLEREKKTNQQTAKATREWKWDFISKSEKKIKLSEIFTKTPGDFSKRQQYVKRSISSILNNTDVHVVRKKQKTIDLVKIRHLARCGGVKCISRLNVCNDKRSKNRRESNVQSPIESSNGGPYILPKPGQLISYIWHSRPSPVFGRKQIYRTGILCSNDGTIRFFESDDKCVAKNNEDRKFYEGRFYLNKKVFKKGNFRVRTDLVVGAICYESEMKLPCKIIKIDEKCGAVLVESIKALDDGTNHLWISPDDLVGNYEVSKIANDRKGRNMTKSLNVNPDDVQSNQSSNIKTTEQIGQISPNHAALIQETIDLTQEDEYELTQEHECESHHGLLHPLTASQNSNDFHFRSKSQFRPEPRGQYFTANSSSAQTSPEMATSWYTSMGITDPSYQASNIGSTFLPDRKTQMTFNNERSRASTVADVCKSLSSVSDFPNNEYNRGRDFGNQNLHDSKFTRSIRRQSSNPKRTQPDFLRFADENLRVRGNSNITSSMVASATLDASVRAQILSDRFAIMASSSSALLHSSATIQSELDLLKQHRMALEILMSASDVGTVVASLQYVKRMHQRGIPVGPTAAKVVSAAEMTSRVLIEDTFLRHMTAPICSGGKSYTVSHAGMILCRLAPILGPNLGRLDSPTVDPTRLLSLGLDRDEVLDILPYIQSFEDEILMKNLSFKRRLTNLY